MVDKQEIGEKGALCGEVLSAKVSFEHRPEGSGYVRKSVPGPGWLSTEALRQEHGWHGEERLRRGGKGAVESALVRPCGVCKCSVLSSGRNCAQMREGFSVGREPLMMTLPMPAPRRLPFSPPPRNHWCFHPLLLGLHQLMRPCH